MSQTSLKTRMLEAFRARMYVFSSIVAIMFLVLVIQLINLQLIHGGEYKSKSRSNMESYVPIPASRGVLYDRTYKQGGENVVVVSNRPSFNITTKADKFATEKELYTVLKAICRLLEVDFRDIKKDIKSKNSWERVIIKEDVGFDTVVKIASNQHIFAHIDWEDAPVRVYNFSNMFSHLVGYIGSISKKEYKRLRSKGYKRYQKIGKTGIEKKYDDLLRGKDGFVRRIVDVRNRTEGEEVGLHPLAGNNLILTVDYEIQKASYEAMGEMKGSVVVLKPSTGEVLALVSKPDFNPNQVISKNNYKIFKELYNNKNKPFLNRVIQAKYPPASTFKLLTAIAALETEKTYASKRYYCPGKWVLKGYTDKDFYCYGVHGSNDLHWAIARSCSVYFYQLGYKTGPTSILKYANYFGLGERTGIDLPGEVASFIPSKKWKLKEKGHSWYDGDTINLSIGQGFLAITPIAIANFVAGIVNNGIVYSPKLVKEIRSPDNKKLVRHFEREKMREIPLSPFTLNTVKQGMRMSVLNGTSIRLRSLKVPAAGKTGTAQTRSKRLDKYSQHAWFVGFAPFGGAPENSVVVAVIVEYGIAGAATAVPVAEKIFTTMYNQGYFK
ncbi:MAG: penicillin-binding protein 2 [bacterium]|nr:penicillin-binding protein 2 [bacterium]